MPNESSFSAEQKTAIADYLNQLSGVHSISGLRQAILNLKSTHTSSADLGLIDEAERIKRDEIEVRLKITKEMQECNTAEEVEKVYKKLLTEHPQEEAYLERYLDRRKGELLSIERQQAKDLEQALNIWGQYKAYRQFRVDKPNVKAGDEVEKDFLKKINDQFSQPRNPEDPDRSLWENPSIDDIYRLAYKIEQKLKKPKHKFKKIEQKLILLELASRTKKTGNSRTRIIYSRIAEKVEGIKKQLGEKVCTHTVIKLKERLRNKEYGNHLEKLAQAINELLDQLNYLREKKASITNCGNGPDNPWNDSNKEWLKKLLKNLKSINDETEILQRLTARSGLYDEKGLGRLLYLYNKAVREAEILLGEYTGNLFSRDMEDEYPGQNASWEDVRVWLVYQSGLYEDIRKVDILWNQFRAHNLIDKDLTRIESLLDRIRDAMDNLDQSDVAYEQRFAALDVQINRLLKMKKALEGLTKVVSREEVKVFEKEELLAKVEELFIIMCDNKGIHSAGTAKANAYAEFLQIMAKLDRMGENETKQFLEDQIVLYDACYVALKSNYTLDIKAIYEGGEGWPGAGVESEFNAELLLRLLYGPQFNLEGKCNNPETQERIKGIHEIINIYSDFMSEIIYVYDEITDSWTYNKGAFHATSQYGPKLKEDLQKTIKEKWKKGKELTKEEEKIFDLGTKLMALLDIRTFYALPFYLAGWSPLDDIGKTIGDTAQRFTNLKALYKAIGKATKGFVIWELMNRIIPTVVLESIEHNFKKLNNIILAEFATALAYEFYAPSLDSGLDRGSPECVVYGSNAQSLNNPVPTITEMFWKPKFPNIKYKKLIGGNFIDFDPADPNLLAKKANHSYIFEDRRDLVLRTATHPQSKKGVPLSKWWEGSKAAEEYVDACQRSYIPSGNMEKDCNIIFESISNLANKLSPTKSLASACDNRRLGNNLYNFCRFAILAFCEKYQDESDMSRFLVHFVERMRSGIQSAATADVKIKASLIPYEFRQRYELPRGNNEQNLEDIKMSTYVLALLPKAELGTLQNWFLKRNSAVPRLFSDSPDKVANDLIVQSVQLDSEVWYKNNLEILQDLGGMPDKLFASVGQKLSNLFRSGFFQRGKYSSFLNSNERRFFPTHLDDDRVVKNPDGSINIEATLRNFFTAIRMFSLAENKTTVKEKKE